MTRRRFFLATQARKIGRFFEGFVEIPVAWFMSKFDSSLVKTSSETPLPIALGDVGCQGGHF